MRTLAGIMSQKSKIKYLESCRARKRLLENSLLLPKALTEAGYLTFQTKEQKKPFFIWHAPLMPHDPHTPPREILAKYTGKGPTPAAEKYYAMVEWFDQTCGELDAYLTKNGLAENTVILYLADNGWDGAYGYQANAANSHPTKWASALRCLSAGQKR